jgi:hypothetical protein
MNVDTHSARSPVAIWERVLIPDDDPLSPAEARYFLRLKFCAEDIALMKSLTAKAKQGTLTPEEDEELENYIRVGHLIGILQSRARQILKDSDRPRNSNGPTAR